MFCAPLVGEFNLFAKLHIYTIAQRYKFFTILRKLFSSVCFFVHKRINATCYFIANRIFCTFFWSADYFAANSICIFSRMVASRAFMMEFFTYVRRTAMAIRRDVALFARVLIWRLRLTGTYSKAISGMMVIQAVQSTIRISVSSEPDSK